MALLYRKKSAVGGRRDGLRPMVDEALKTEQAQRRMTPEQLPGAAPPPQPAVPRYPTGAPAPQTATPPAPKPPPIVPTPTIQPPAPPGSNQGWGATSGDVLSIDPGPGGTLPGGGRDTFGPGDNLINRQINPTGSPQFQRLQDLLTSFTERLGNLPDRTELAKEAFKNIEGSISDQRRRGIQDIGRSAARLGRLGSGQVTTDLGNLEERLGISRDRALRDLATQTAGQRLSDVLGSMGGLANIENMRFGQGLSGREELRGEREYQRGMSEQAKQDAINAWLAQQQAFNEQFGQEQSLTNLLGGYGYGSGENFGPAMALSQLLGGASQGGLEGLYRLFANQGAVQQEPSAPSNDVGLMQLFNTIKGLF